MDNTRIEKLADALLACAKDEELKFKTYNCERARRYVSPKANQHEVGVARDLLLELRLINRTSEDGVFLLTDLGIAKAGRLPEYRTELSERDIAVHKAHLATADAVQLSKDQAQLARDDARRARNAMVASVIAAFASALIALLSWLYPRHGG